MSVSTFIKENRVLVAGLVLPLLLTFILALAKNIPSTLVAPPTYQVAYFTSDWSQKGNLGLKIDANGHLAADFKKSEGYKSSPSDQEPKATLYIYDPKTNQTTDTILTLGKDDALPTLEKFSDLKFSNSQTSPDGYVFESYHYRDHSLITDIFAYRPSDNNPALTKNGNVVKLSLPKNSYGNTTFLGWVIPENAPSTTNGGQK